MRRPVIRNGRVVGWVDVGERERERPRGSTSGSRARSRRNDSSARRRNKLGMAARAPTTIHLSSFPLSPSSEAYRRNICWVLLGKSTRSERNERVGCRWVTICFRFSAEKVGPRVWASGGEHRYEGLESEAGRKGRRGEGRDAVNHRTSFAPPRLYEQRAVGVR